MFRDDLIRGGLLHAHGRTVIMLKMVLTPITVIKLHILTLNIIDVLKFRYICTGPLWDLCLF